MAGMLYYPSINAPQQVLRQTALYWDYVTTVVPDGSDGSERSYLNSAMCTVMDAGLYRPTKLSSLRDIQERMLRQLEGIPQRLLAREGSLSSGGSGLHRLYVEKFHPDVADHLVERGLVLRHTIPGDGHAGDVLVSEQGELYMLSIVAREIAAQRNGDEGCSAPNSLIPYTDRSLAHQLSCTFRSPSYGRNSCWKIEVGALLPAPRDDVPLSELIAFRERYDDERRRLMFVIHLLAHELGRVYNHPHDVFRALRRELEDALKDLVAAGREKRINWIRRSVALTVALGTAFAGNQVLPAGGWVLGVVGGYALNIATTNVEPRMPGRGDDFSYLHRAHLLARSS